MGHSPDRWIITIYYYKIENDTVLVGIMDQTTDPVLLSKHTPSIVIIIIKNIVIIKSIL